MTSTPYPGSARAKAAENEARDLGSGLYDAEPPPEHSAESLLAVPVTGTPRAANGDDAVYRTAVLSANNTTRMVLPQDPQRYRAWILPVDGPVIICESKDLASEAANTAGTASPSYAATGGATTPAAGTSLASVSVPAGTWTVAWMIRNQVATGLANNYGLYVNGPSGTLEAISLNSSAVQTTTQLSVTVTLTAPGTISVNAIATDATGTYDAALTATAAAGTAVTGAAAPQGAYIPAGALLPVTHKQQVWAALAGAVSPCRVTVITERYQDPCPS